MTTPISTVRRALGAMILIAAVLAAGAGAAAADTGDSEPAGYLGGSSDQGSVDVNPAQVTPSEPDDSQAAGAMALTGADIAIALAWTGAALVAVGVLVMGGTRLIARRR